MAFTEAERASMAAFDAFVDGQPMTAEDYSTSAFVDYILFYDDPHTRAKAARNARIHARQAALTQADRAAQQAKYRAYADANRDRIKATKAAWYKRNRAERLAKQRAYRQRVTAAASVTI